MGSAAYPAFPVGHLGFRATSEQKDNAKCVKKAVWDYINRLRIDEGYERREQHDASFLATAENVINAFAGYGDDDSSFGFGNAQKLINMTAKYIALGFYMDDCRENFQYCHCPMDGIMVEKVITLLEGREDIRETFGLEKRGWKGVLRDTAWSKIEKAKLKKATTDFNSSWIHLEEMNLFSKC